ncbi:phosphate ABC transporter permease subunit PstC [Candidatus Igneacidithiobacillus taiwanensis]|uniref:phosphate ABC transporter permease subunit PstC n=1 Tax=Candidatus Igneacidithiobacillus taiwanensis TaxID=1945924 RepID=UPI00289B21EF|nr:phosphate ABC transporter permease subunit PstC [Candidatus Igneacidithiobacillus taiwanensis]
MDSPEAMVNNTTSVVGASEQYSVGRKQRSPLDFLFRVLTGGSALLVGLILLAIMASLTIEGWEALRTFGWRFFISQQWNPVTNQYGALIFIVGTLVSSLIAMIVAIPVSFGIALFITELAPSRIKSPISSTIELLAAIPSIIFGMWGLLVFAPKFAMVEPWITDTFGDVPGLGVLFRGPPMGIGMLAAGIVLGIMVIPFISAIMCDVFSVVPNILRESAYGLGATTWEVVWNVVLPYTRAAVFGGIFLGLGRALGETMAVTFVIGNTDMLSRSLLMPGASIASVIANEFTEATTSLYRSALLALGLILFIITIIVLSVARIMLARIERKSGGK